MPTITGQQIVDRAWIILQDTNGGTGIRHPSGEQLLWVNDAQREVVVVLPSAFVRTTVAVMAVGTRQTLAGLGFADGVQFMKMTRNFNAAGTVAGRAITPKPMAWIDDSKPNWHADPAADVIHYFFDPGDPKTIYNWPPANGTSRAEFVYAAVPPDLAALANVISLDDIYSNAMQYYVLFRSFSKNATFTKAPQLAASYYQLFLQSLGVKDARVKSLDVNRQMLSDGAGVTSTQAGGA